MEKLRNNIFYSGMADPTLRVFDIVMETQYGTTYNSYVVKGEKTAVIECVHEKFADEFIEKFNDIKVDYIICNHTEPDHSGSVKRLIEKYPDATVVGTIAAVRNLKEITNITFNEYIAKDGAELDLGNGVVLKFIIAPNLHWPDTMMTYMPSEKVMFSCDVFGSHYYEGNIYDSEIVHKDNYEKSFKYYYDCIVSPFAGFVKTGLEKVKDLQIEMICPSHGPVIVDNIELVVKKYAEYANEEKIEKNTLGVFYASAYGYTREMADIIAQTAKEKGYNVKMFDMEDKNIEKMMSAVNSVELLAVGSCTINKNAPDIVWKVLSGIDAINSKGKPCMVFGSYGWSGEAVGHIHSYLKMFKLNVYDKPFSCVFRMSDAERNELKDYTEKFLESAK